MKRTKEQISYNMSRIRSKGSAMEKTLGRVLWKEGLRYRKHYKKLVGIPDFVLVKYKIAIFCDSEFWHGYNWGEERKNEFKVNRTFWINKIERNIERDRIVNKTLHAQGWKLIRFWEKDIKKDANKCVQKVHSAIISRKKKREKNN